MIILCTKTCVSLKRVRSTHTHTILFIYISIPVCCSQLPKFIFLDPLPTPTHIFFFFFLAPITTAGGYTLYKYTQKCTLRPELRSCAVNREVGLGSHFQSHSWAWVLIPNAILGPGSTFPMPFLGLGPHSQSHSFSSFAPNKPCGFCGRRASTTKERKKAFSLWQRCFPCYTS